MLSWTQITSSTTPSARFDAPMAYHTASGVFILLGGTSGDSNPIGDAWSYDSSSNSWKNIELPSFLQARFGASMTYDSDTQKIIVFGGRSNNNVCLNDTWSFDGTTWTQLTLNLPSQQPSPRCHASMVYDQQMQKVILFGGDDVSGYVDNTTWNFDMSSQTWQPLPCQGTPPQPRSNASMAYNSISKTAVLYGGFLDETYTWIFDGRTNPPTWTQKTTTSYPVCTYAPSMVYDSTLKQIVLFGGSSSSGISNDVWAFDGSNWKQLTNTSNDPQPRFLAL